MLITTPAQFAAYVTVNKGISIESLRTHVRHAERQHILPALGTTLYNALTAYNGTGNATYDALLIKVREPLALLAMRTLLPDIQVQTSDAGATVTWSENYRPALPGQIDAKLEALQLCGMSALDALYDYLQETNPSSWRTSDAGKDSGATLLRTSAEFSEGYPIANSRTTFIDLRPAMLRAQDFDIAPAIGSTFLDTLLAHQRTAGNNSYYDTAIAKLKPALAQLAVGRSQDVLLQYVNGGLISTRWVQQTKDAVNDPGLQQVSAMRTNAAVNGKALLAIAQKWMDDNASNLTGYTARTNSTELPDVSTRIHNNDGLAAF